MNSYGNGNLLRNALSVCLVIGAALGALLAADATPSNETVTFRQYCFQCHGKGAALGGVSLEKLLAEPSMGESFQHWEKVAAALEQKRMPPEKMPQPSDAQRAGAVIWIRAKLNEFAQKYAGDPGRVTVRRLTSGEYAYTVKDLTELDLKVDGDFVADSVGGEGFTNFGDVQFMEDANLERYLSAAKTIADHAVIGSGPLEFYADPGKSGFELSAINRIQEIYKTYGFRTVSGEGGRPYGLDRYGKALYASWHYLHRAALGESAVTLDTLAAREGITTQFTKHVWSVLHRTDLGYPSSEVASRWRKLAAPSSGAKASTATARAACEEIQKYLVTWPSWLFGRGDVAAGGAGDERPLEFSDESLKANPTHRFRFMTGRGFGRQQAPRTGPTRIYLNVVSVNPKATAKSVVIWRNASIVIRRTPGRAPNDSQQSRRSSGQSIPGEPLRLIVTPETAAKLGFGTSPDGSVIGPDDFASEGSVSFEAPMPEGAFGVELQVDASLGRDRDQVYRITFSDREDGGTRGVPVWGLLGDPESSGYRVWKEGVLQFASLLPPNSHSEPNPADKDPIPPPFDKVAYNQPERDAYIVKVKYYRNDRFVAENMLDAETRARLDHAWNDLYASFEYHDAFLRMIAERFNLDLKGKGIADLDKAQIESLPAEPRQYVRELREGYEAVQKAQKAGQPGHVEDCIKFASRAWRRPLSEPEKLRLRSFYTKSRETGKLDHPKAIRALLARILISPAFLYRVEQQPAEVAGVKPLSGWEMANRLSYFLWSSMPDEELRRAAQANELSDPQQLERQVKRMLTDPKARRLATEFFGQWLGFYRFDQYRGIDTTRFTEFTDDLKEAMYDEAVSFFEHIIRKDRPVREMIFADYTFLNRSLAKHYGVQKEIKSTDQPELVEGASTFQRGGLLRLGAVLTATSAPLRTSPVKRGDWVLRRVLGTPTPPPPADAGSIPADEKLFGGLTLREKLAAHQRNPTCANCHSRIDPLGFPLERYDAIGRWRDKYSDGTPIHDSVEQLIEHLKKNEQQVVRSLAQKLLGYALGRTIQVSDRPLIERMTESGSDTPLSKLITEIVSSRQFRYRRVPLADARGSVPVASLTEPRPQGAVLPPNRDRQGAVLQPNKEGAR